MHLYQLLIRRVVEACSIYLLFTCRDVGRERQSIYCTAQAFPDEAVSCLLWEKKTRRKKKTFYITAENIESVKDGTFKRPISDRYYCVVLDVYLPCTAVLL